MSGQEERNRNAPGRARFEWALVIVLGGAAVWLATQESGPEAGADPAPVVAEEPAADPIDTTPRRVDPTPLPAEPRTFSASPEPGWSFTVDQHSVGLPSGGNWRGRPDIADLNGDGRLDLVTSIRRIDNSTPGEGLHVWLQQPDHSWIPANDGLSRTLSYGGAEIADVNGDGHLDIAFSGHTSVPTVWLGDGSGEVWAASPTPLPPVESIASDVAVGHLDDDGLLDLVTMGFYPASGGLRFYKGDGQGGYELDQLVFDESHFGAVVEFADLDGDGDDEVLAMTSLGPKVWQREGEAWVDRSEGLPTPDVGGSMLAVDAADLDGDGDLELLVGGMITEDHRTLTMYERLPDASWAPWGSISGIDAVFDLTFTRIDPERPPLALTAAKEGLAIYAMTDVGRFSLVGRVPETRGILNVATADIDGVPGDEVLIVGNHGVQVLTLDITWPGTAAAEES